MFAIFKKELWTYFGNFSAWVIIGAFSLIGTLFLFFFENDFNIFDIGTATLQSYFVLAPWLLLFIIPALSMKTLAEENQSGTLSWLFSQPVKIFEIILGKFFAVWILGACCILPSLVYLYTIYDLGIVTGNVDLGATFGSYFGLIFLIGAFSAVGIFASALSSNQVMAYLVGVLLSFLLYFGIEQLSSYKLLGAADYYLANLGFYKHFLSFTRGLIDTRDVFYFIIVMAVFLFSARILVDRKK